MVNPIGFGNINITDLAINKVEEGENKKFESILQEVTSSKQEKELKVACQNFEALFLNMIFKSMRNTIQKSEFMADSFATNMYEDMLYEKFSEEAAKDRGIGLGDMLYKQLSKNLERGDENIVE
ncbi:MAG: rod-binding protein [Firmicutes bacterium]|nr:rod-binding protein [Bacillota bacterium]